MTKQSKLSVAPSHVSFDYEAGQSHTIPFTVQVRPTIFLQRYHLGVSTAGDVNSELRTVLQNAGESTCSVRVQLPSTQYLSLRRVAQGSATCTKQLPVARLAPGMRISFEMVFHTPDLTTAVDHSTELWVQYDGGKEVVPIHCCAPKCECVLQGSLDFGLVTCGSGTDPSRQVYVVNEGKRAGEWSLSVGEGSIPLQLKPASGSLGPGERQAVTATLQDISIGQYVGSVALSTGAGKNPKRYSCNAQAVTATFQTVGQRGQTLLEVDFGTVLNHDRRTQIVYLVNSSAQNVTCGIELGSTATMKPAAPGAGSEIPEGDNPYASFVAAARVRAEALAAASKAPFSVQPAHVQIPAFQKVPVKLIYTPVHPSPRKGFSSKLETGTDLHNYTAVIEVHGEAKRVSRLPLKGKCAYNVAEVSPTSLEFQDDFKSQICQQQFCVKNRAKALSMRYHVKKLPPFFHVHPRQGTVPAGATSALDVFYKPKALGAHDGKVQLSIHTEHGRLVEQHAIHVHGVCDNAHSVLPGKIIPVPDCPGKLASHKAQKNRVSFVPGLKHPKSQPKAAEDDFIVADADDMYNGDPGLGRQDDALWLATSNMPATYTPTKELSPESIKRVHIHQEMLSKENGGNRPLEKAEIRAIRAGPPVVHFGTMATCAENTQYFCITNTLQHPIHALVDAKSHDHLIGSSNLSQAIPAGQSAVFSLSLRSTSAKSFRHSVEFILNGLHFLHFDIHADVIDPMISVSNSELEFALSTSDWLSHVDKVVMLENPNKFPCSFQWQVPSPSPFTVTPMTGNMPGGSSLDTVVRWTQDKDDTGKQEAQLVLRINGGVTSRTISVRGNPPEGLVKWKASKLHLGSVPVGLPVTATTFVVNKGLADSVVRVMSSPNVECTPESSLVSGGDMIPMEISFVPQDAGTFKSLITAEQRGGKILTLPLVAEAIMPQVSIEQHEFNFGVVYFGANKKLPLTVVNSGPVPAQVVFDFAEHPLFALSLAPEQWEALEEYTENPLQLKDAAIEDKTVECRPCAAPGNRYCLDMKAGSSFTLSFSVTASMVTAEAFPLPMFLPRDKGTTDAVPEILVLADCLETRLTITPALVDLGSCIIPSASSVRSAYEYTISVTSQQDSVLEWSCTPPTTESMEGCKGVFTVSELGRELQPLESCTIKVLFIPKAPTKYGATIEFSAKLPHEESPLPLMTMELKGEGRYPQLLFDRPVAFLPAVPVGFTSQTQFMIHNDGYDNVELRHRLPPDEENLPIVLDFPQGNVLGIAKAALPVIVKLTVQRPQSFTVELEFMDENGTRYKMLLSGVCDRSILTLQPFLGCNSWRPQGRADEAAINLMSEIEYEMPKGSFTVAMPELPKLFTMYINHTALKGPYQDVLNECIFSRGKVFIDLMEAFSGRTVAGKTHSFSSDPAKAAPQVYDQYCSILAFLQRHGALVNLVHPEQMMSSSEVLQLLSIKTGQAKGNRLNSKLWQKEVAACDWEATVKHAWVYIFFQFMKTFIFHRIDVATMKTLPGSDWTQQPELQNRLNSNVYSIPECICLNWLTFHLRRVLPQGPKQINNYTSDLEDGLALCAVLVSHWPALSDLQSQIVKQPSQLSDRESNAKVFISMLLALQCPFQVEESDILTPNQCNMLCLVAYLYNWLPQLIPVSTVVFSGKLQEEQTRQVEMTNPSNKALSYSVRLQGHPDFSIPSQSLILEPNGTSQCVVTCKPTAGRPQTSHLIFTSRKDGAALGRTMVLKLESEVLTDAPLKRIKTEKPQYEMKIFEFALADCEFHITLHPIEPDAPAKTPDTPKKGKGKSKKQMPPEVEDRALYPHPFGIFKTVVKLAKNAEEKLRAAFLPFTSGVHLCTVKFSDREHGSFCYELVGQALPPSICAENEFVMDLNRPVTAYLQVGATNQQLEAAKKTFMEGHPLAKKKELVQMLTVQRPRESLRYSVSHVSSLIQCSESVTLTDKVTQDDESAVKLDLKPIGIGIYPDRIMLTSVQDVRLHDVEIHVKELEHTFTLAFGAQLNKSLTQQIPVFNTNSEKPVTVVVELTAQTEEARGAFDGPPEVAVPVATPSFYPLIFTPPRIGRFKACLTLSVAATQEKWTYNLEAVGQEPPATEHITFKSTAGSSKPLKLSVSNLLDTTVEYTVFTDMACMQGPASIEVPGRGSADYDLCLRPMLPGLLMGLVSFSTSTGQLQWYSFEVEVSEAPKIDTIHVQTAVGGAKEIEVQVCNPSDRRVELTAIYGHINLVGPASIKLDPRQADRFKFYFSPIEAGDCTTRFTLRNQQLGEFWYEVRMSTT